MKPRTFNVVPIQQVDVYATVRTQLAEFIESECQPGERLPAERALAQALNVSRPAVREALRVLESMGKVEIRQGVGTFVLDATRSPCVTALLAEHPVDRDYLAHLIDVRAAIEIKVVERAAERMSDASLADLRDVLARNEREHLADAEEGSLNLLFEAALARAAGNPLLASMQRIVHQLWVEAWGRLSLAPGSKHQLHDEHRAILAALERRDADAAVRLMREHVDRLLEGSVLREETHVG